MTAKGHIVLAIPIIAVSLIVAEKYLLGEGTLNKQLIVLYYATAIFGSLLPDIDEPESYIGRRIPIFSNILSIFISHRGITHYLCIPLIMIIIAYFQEDMMLKVILLGLSFGILAHDAGDMLTKGGIRGFFFPLFPTRTVGLMPKFMRFYTNSITEYFVIAIIMAITMLAVVKYSSYIIW